MPKVLTPKTMESPPVPTPNFMIASLARTHKPIAKQSGINQQMDIKLASRR